MSGGFPTRAALALLAALALTLSAGGQLAKYLGAWAIAPAFALYFIAAFRLDRVTALLTARGAAVAVVAITGLLAAAFIVVFPLADSGVFGPGSDRDDALNLAVGALVSGAPIYGQTTYLFNPITPSPGAVLLAAPFALMGEAAWQNLLWLPALAGLAALLLGRSAAAYLALFAAANPAFLQDFLTGGDYGANAIYVTCATVLALKLAQGRAGAALGGALLGFALLSRPVYLVALVVVGGALWRRGGRNLATPFAIAVIAVAAIVAAPIFVSEPQGLSLTHAWWVSGLSAPAAAAIAALALALTAPAFLTGMKTLDATGLLALGLAALLVPPALAKLPDLTSRLFDLTFPAALIGGLWLTARLAAPRPPRDGASPHCDLPDRSAGL